MTKTLVIAAALTIGGLLMPSIVSASAAGHQTHGSPEARYQRARARDEPPAKLTTNVDSGGFFSTSRSNSVAPLIRATSQLQSQSGHRVWYPPA